MDPKPPTTNPSGIGAEFREEDAQGNGSDSEQPDLRLLVRQVRELERRVHALEGRPEGNPAPFVQASSKLTPTRMQPSGGTTANAIPVFGGALLAIAGAYLLRALTEYKLLPLNIGVAAGILYAFIWLTLASRAAAKKPLVAAIRGTTSALILVPLLWEAAVHFGALVPWTAAGIIVVYTCFGLAISWYNNLAITAWTTTLASLLAAVALLIATHDLVPFTLAILAIAAVLEGSACFDRWLRERWIVALVTDLALLFLASIAASDSGAPEGYVPISAAMALAMQIALPMIYLSSTSLRTLAYGANLTAFEITQIALALLLSASGVLRIGHGGAATVELVAACSWLCGALFYRFSFGFDRSAAWKGKNFYAYSSLGLVLVLIGTLMQFSGAVVALALSLFGLLALLVARWMKRTVLYWHSTVYLLLATTHSGLAAWAAANLLGTRHGWMRPPLAAGIAAAATLLACLLIGRSAKTPSSFSAQAVPALALAAAATWGLAGLTAGALNGLCGGTFLEPLCTAFQTFVLTALAMLLALSGMAWKRRELIWLVYPWMVLTAYKLLVQDLRRGQTVSLFVSLFLYGGALILLPRIVQRSSASI